MRACVRERDNARVRACVRVHVHGLSTDVLQKHLFHIIFYPSSGDRVYSTLVLKPDGWTVHGQRNVSCLPNPTDFYVDDAQRPAHLHSQQGNNNQVAAAFAATAIVAVPAAVAAGAPGGRCSSTRLRSWKRGVCVAVHDMPKMQRGNVLVRLANVVDALRLVVWMIGWERV